MARALSPSTPLHLSAYRPAYKMTLPATPLDTLERAWKHCTESLDYVYIGNVYSGVGTDTLCPACQAVLIKRSGFMAQVTGITEGCCGQCGREVDLVGV